MSGAVTIVVALLLGAWVVWFLFPPRGGVVFMGLSPLPLLAGGGFGRF